MDLDNPQDRRAIAARLLIVFASTGLASMVDAKPDAGTELSLRLEWALRTIGLTSAEISEATIYVRTAIETLNIDQELDELFGGGE